MVNFVKLIGPDGISREYISREDHSLICHDIIQQLSSPDQDLARRTLARIAADCPETKLLRDSDEQGKSETD